MIKRGQANVGDFWIPNLDGDLVLQERKSSIDVGSLRVNWVFDTTTGHPQTCDGVCWSVGGTCQENEFAAVSSPALFETVLGSKFVCSLPIVSNCNSTGPFMADNYCYFPDSTACGSRQHEAATCSVAPAVYRYHVYFYIYLYMVYIYFYLYKKNSRSIYRGMGGGSAHVTARAEYATPT